MNTKSRKRKYHGKLQAEEKEKEKETKLVQVQIKAMNGMSFQDIPQKDFPNTPWVVLRTPDTPWTSVFLDFAYQFPKWLDLVFIPRSIPIRFWDWSDPIGTRDQVVHLVNQRAYPRLSLRFRLEWMSKKNAWPPCDNFWSTDPLNDVPIGHSDFAKIYCCSACSDASLARPYKVEQDNSFENMIVITTKFCPLFRTGVNRHHYLAAINHRFALCPTDSYVCPLTLMPITDKALSQINDVHSTHFRVVTLDEE